MESLQRRDEAMRLDEDLSKVFDEVFRHGAQRTIWKWIRDTDGD
jgi:hypothetical protein